MGLCIRKVAAPAETIRIAPHQRSLQVQPHTVQTVKSSDTQACDEAARDEQTTLFSTGMLQGVFIALYTRSPARTYKL